MLGSCLIINEISQFQRVKKTEMPPKKAGGKAKKTATGYR